MKYFAYGSNMSEKRLQKRVPSAVRVGRCKLEGYQLRFHKASEDGSAKCDAFYTNNSSDLIFGALFEMNETERIFLDKAEGLGQGYDEKIVEVISDNGTSEQALIYVATKIDKSLLPYSWYLNHVIVGALETGLPTDYLISITKTPSINDSDCNRELIELDIYTTNHLS